MTVRVQRLALVFCVPSLLSVVVCNRLLWREHTDFPAAAWLDERRVAEAGLRYEEKRSWDPLAGTTLKRNNSSFVRVLAISVGAAGAAGAREQIVTESPSFGGSVEDGLFEFLGEMVMMRRVSGTRGDTHVDLMSWRAGSKEIKERLRTPFAGATLVRVVPSPDRKRLALLFLAEGGASRVAIVESLDLRGLELQGKPTWEGLTDVSWSKESTRLYLLVGRQVLSWDGVETPMPASRFPRCFNPPTRYSGNISEEGLSFYRADPDRPAEIRPIPKWVRHDRIPLATHVNAVGRDCI